MLRKIIPSHLFAVRSLNADLRKSLVNKNILLLRLQIIPSKNRF